MNWITLTIAVPSSHLARFHAHHGAWLTEVVGDSEQEPDETGGPALAWGSGENDVELAAELWQKLSSRAQAMLSVLVESPEQKFSGSWLAEELDIPNGMYGVAGALAWPKRHAAKIGRQLPVQFEYGQLGEGANYWMDETTAAVFRRAAGAGTKGR